MFTEQIFKNFSDSLEYKNWGYNFITAIFLILISISLFQIIGAIRQRRRIKRQKTSKSWTIDFFAYLAAYFLSFIFYGWWQKHSLTLVVSGLPGIVYFFTIFTIWRHKERSLKNLSLALSFFLLVIILMIAIDGSGVAVVMVFLLGALVTAKQAWTMIRNNNYSDVDPGFLWSFLLSSAFWACYSWYLFDWVVIISSSSSSIFLILFLCLYYHKLNKKRLILRE